MECLVENDVYTEKDFEGIQIFADEKLVERRIKTDDLANNESVPSGWKTKISDGKSGKQIFVSPDGQQFANRRAGLQHMILNNFPPKSIETMRKSSEN